MRSGAIRGSVGVLVLMAAAALVDMPQPAYAAIVSRSILKTFFETGDVPTQAQFSTLLDSFINRTDDGLVLVGAAVIPDGTPGGSFLRLGAGVGINEPMPDAHAALWRKAPAPNIPPIPGMNPSFRGQTGYLPLQYEDAAGEPHYAFLHVTMADDAAPLGGTAAGFAAAQAADPGPAIFVRHWVWETTPGATLTSFAVPEPTAAVLAAIGLAGCLGLRRRM